MASQIWPEYEYPTINFGRRLTGFSFCRPVWSSLLFFPRGLVPASFATHRGMSMTITQEAPSASLSPASARIYVTKRDGTRIPYNADRLNRALERAAEGLSDPIAKVTQVAAELEITLFDGITTEQLDEAAIAAAIQNAKDDPGFDVIAARLLRKVIAKRVVGPYEAGLELHLLHRARFPGYVRDAVEDGILDQRLADLFDLDELAAALKPERDDLLRYIGTVTMHNRYMIDGKDHRALEVPQYFWMRVAMGLTLNEENPTTAAIDIYDKISTLDYLPAGSTLANAGTSHPQLSNCGWLVPAFASV